LLQKGEVETESEQENKLHADTHTMVGKKDKRKFCRGKTL